MKTEEKCWKLILGEKLRKFISIPVNRNGAQHSGEQARVRQRTLKQKRMLSYGFNDAHTEHIVIVKRLSC